MARHWFQFSLKSLMAVVVLICLGLGGWHLLWTKGQYVIAEPAVVGQPIKIHGSFLRFRKDEYDDNAGRYDLLFDEVLDSGSHSWLITGIAEPMFRQGEEMLSRYVTELPQPQIGHFRLLLINNSSLPFTEKRMNPLGVMHKAEIVIRTSPNGGS
jgi:hypothetical protein